MNSNLSEQRNPYWPHVIKNHDELFDATDAGFLNGDELSPVIEAAGGTLPYLLSRLEAATKLPEIADLVDNLDMGTLQVEPMQEKVYRGSGAYQPIDVTLQDNFVTEFPINTALSSGFPEVRVGILFIDDEGIQSQILRSLSGEESQVV